MVAIDLQEMAPIEGIKILKGDITHASTLNQIMDIFDGEKADLVICDGAPDVTGLHDIDQYIQGQLLLCALGLVTCILKENGTFIAKIFRGKDVSVLYGQIHVFFESVSCCKPKSSRNSSIEAFVVCRGYHTPLNYVPKLPSELLEAKDESEINRYIAPFIACGDLSGKILILNKRV